MQSLIVDGTHPVLISGKLALPKLSHQLGETYHNFWIQGTQESCATKKFLSGPECSEELAADR